LEGVVLHKKIILILLVIFFSITPLAEAQEFDFKEMNYSVLLKSGATSLNINPIFNFRNDLNRLSLDLNYNGNEFKLGGTWLIKAQESKDYQTEAALSILSKSPDKGFTASIGIEGSRFLNRDREVLYELKYIISGQTLEYRVGYLTPIVKNNYLILSIGNSYWESEPLLLEAGFKVQF